MKNASRDKGVRMVPFHAESRPEYVEGRRLLELEGFGGRGEQMLVKLERPGWSPSGGDGETGFPSATLDTLG